MIVDHESNQQAPHKSILTFFTHEPVLIQEYLGFLLLSMADLFLTGWIFRHQGMEANTLALWVLRTFNFAGFAVFKFLMVVFIIVLCEIIATKDLGRARLIILGGCAVYFFVVVYECVLIYQNVDVPAVHGDDQTSAIIRTEPLPISSLPVGVIYNAA